MKLFISLLLASSSLTAIASPEDGKLCLASASGKEVSEISSTMSTLQRVAQGCPNNFDPTKLLGICQEIEDQSALSIKMVLDAACVTSKDSESVKYKKVQKMWEANQCLLVCNNATAFGIKDGNILKYAVKMEAFDFLTIATEDWKVNLNYVDLADKRTVLDYVQDEMKSKPKNSPMWISLNNYYTILRSAGAKHKNELPVEYAKK